MKNDELAGGNAWIAVFFIVLAEILNILCHRFVWVYKARSTKEGIEFGAIEASSDKTAYEIQLQRLGAFLQSRNFQISGIEQIQIPGQAPTKSEPESSKIGYRVHAHHRRHDPSAPKNPDVVERVVQKVIVLKEEVHGFEITCANCGKLAIMKRKSAKFCSRKCRIKKYNEGVRERRRRLNFEG